MNRVVAGVIALAAVAVLCAATPGSMAYWQDSAQTQEITIEAGSLSLTPVVGSDTWARGDGRAIASVVAPGDTIRYTQEFEVEKEGEFPVTLTLTPGTVSTLGAFALESATLAGDGLSRVGSSLVWDVLTDDPVTVTLVYTWPYGDVAANGAQDTVLSVAASDLFLTQVPR